MRMPWWTSYFSLMPRRIATVSSTDGSPTKTGWKRRSSAASFSMYLRYSSSVVAPMQRSSPRASIGLSMLAASTAPSAAPAPTIVCSSSMKRISAPSAFLISVRTAFSRSSNSPRYFEPASRAPMSSAQTRLPFRPSGTSPATIRCASPSAIAVLPTPGSPIRTGLFLVRRERTWITRRISSSRPMTGSSLPCSAATASCDFRVNVLKSMSPLVLSCAHRPRRLVDDEVAAVLLVNVRDFLVEPAFEALDPHMRLPQLVLEPQHDLHASQVEPELGREALDQPQPLQVRLGIKARVPARALRADEALVLVDPQRLRVHADELRGDRDHVTRAVVDHASSSSRRGPQIRSITASPAS